MQQKKLEHYKWFPIVAWALTISFTLFVINMVLDLRATADQLEHSTMNINNQIRTMERMLEEQMQAEVDVADSE